MGLCGSVDADFEKSDLDHSGTMSKAEMRSFVVSHRHGQLYETIQLNLSLTEERAKEIATHVAFTLAGGQGPTDSITQAQFKKFKARWVEDPKGNQEFMLHTVFGSVDTDGDGFVEEDELDGLANLFFDGSWLSPGDPRMKQFKGKEDFKRQIRAKCDLDHDGKFSFAELSGLISGRMDLTAP